MAYDPELQEASNDAENEDREKSRYIAALAWPGDRCNQSSIEIVPGKHTKKRYQEAEIASTGYRSIDS